VGSTNKVKLDAVREAISQYSRFNGGMILSVDVKSGVGSQPMTLEETTLGAINRAKYF